MAPREISPRVRNLANNILGLTQAVPGTRSGSADVCTALTMAVILEVASRNDTEAEYRESIEVFCDLLQESIAMLYKDNDEIVGHG